MQEPSIRVRNLLETAVLQIQHSPDLSEEEVRWIQQFAAHVMTEEPRFPLLLTHANIAGMLGSTRETVTRILSQFRRKGMIRFEGYDIVLTRGNSPMPSL